MEIGGLKILYEPAYETAFSQLNFDEVSWENYVYWKS